MKVKIACSLPDRLRGLLGHPGHEDVLLIVPCNDVHTFGMRRAIDIAFIASDGTVIESYRHVGVRRRIRCASAVATLERFAADDPWFTSDDRVELKRLVRESWRKSQ